MPDPTTAMRLLHLALHQHRHHKMTDADLDAALQPPPDLTPLEAINWRNIICDAIPFYNILAEFEGWPHVPLPQFCGATAHKA
jgi:hypothetical protein